MFNFTCFIFIFNTFYVACKSTSSSNGHHQASDVLTVTGYFNVGSYLLVQRHLWCTEFGGYYFGGELYSQTVYENVNGFVSVHSLASDQQAFRCLPTPTPLAFLRGGSACTQTISKITKRVCEQATPEPTNTRHVNSFNKSTASCLVLKFVIFLLYTFYGSLLTYVIDR